MRFIGFRIYSFAIKRDVYGERVKYGIWRKIKGQNDQEAICHMFVFDEQTQGGTMESVR